MREVKLITPFTENKIRSRPAAPGSILLSGRWAAINASGQAALPAAGAAGVYLMVEGLYTVNDGLLAADYAGSTPFLPTVATNYQPLPSAIASQQVALAYGIFLYDVAPVGYLATSLILGSSLKVDNAGRLVLWVQGTDIESARVAVVESLPSGASQILRVRTLGN